MTDPRPGFEEQGRRRVWRPGSELLRGLGVGVLMAAVLLAVLPDLRHHMFGGTDLRSTFAWLDGDGAEHISTFKRSGPIRHEVGDTWELWVSPDRPTAQSDAPWVSWWWFGPGIPLIGVALGWLRQWRHRVIARSAVRGVHAQGWMLSRSSSRLGCRGVQSSVSRV